jgi:WD40 repeat protein
MVKCLDAHFARIIDIQSLTVGSWNSVITSSIDRTVKVWNINYIFEQVHHIDRHELQIDSVSLSTDAGIAVVVTRNCIGIWDILTGKLKTKLADSTLGAIVTHAEVTDNGEYIIAAESGYVLYWNVAAEAVIFKEEQKDILQVSFQLYLSEIPQYFGKL